MLPFPFIINNGIFIGDSCQGNVEDALKKMEKRNPNFLRFGRSGGGQ